MIYNCRIIRSLSFFLLLPQCSFANQRLPSVTFDSVEVSQFIAAWSPCICIAIELTKLMPHYLYLFTKSIIILLI